MKEVTLSVFRGTNEEPQNHRREDFSIPQVEGMVVLDAIHEVQRLKAHDLAVRWNCKAGKCGSCSAEVNGKPSLMCMTRLDSLDLEKPVVVEPMKRFPLVKDLVTDVSWNYRVNQKIKPLRPKPREADGTYRMMQYDIDRIQEFHKCIECFLCQDVCHVLRDHNREDAFVGPRFMIRLASLVMHPLDTEERLQELKDTMGVGYCNITKCCTEVCPEHIQITDNAIIPLKERVAGAFYDPLAALWRKLTGRSISRTTPHSF